MGGTDGSYEEIKRLLKVSNTGFQNYYNARKLPKLLNVIDLVVGMGLNSIEELFEIQINGEDKIENKTNIIDCFMQEQAKQNLITDISLKSNIKTRDLGNFFATYGHKSIFSILKIAISLQISVSDLFHCLFLIKTGTFIDIETLINNPFDDLAHFRSYISDFSEVEDESIDTGQDRYKLTGKNKDDIEVLQRNSRRFFSVKLKRIMNFDDQISYSDYAEKLKISKSVMTKLCTGIDMPSIGRLIDFYNQFSFLPEDIFNLELKTGKIEKVEIGEGNNKWDGISKRFGMKLFTLKDWVENFSVDKKCIKLNKSAYILLKISQELNIPFIEMIYKWDYIWSNFR